MNRSGLETPNRRLWARPSNKTLLVVGLILLAALLIIVTVRGNSSGPNVLSPTNLTAVSNFGYLVNNEVLSYDKATFYSTNINNGKRSELFGGRKLPAIKSLYWTGKDGAIVVFKGSLTGTVVQDYLNDVEPDSKAADAQKYSWYIDFKRKSLVLVDKQSVDTGEALYDSDNRIFYYTKRPQAARGDSPNARLYTYNLDSRVTDLIMESNDIAYITSLTLCSSPLTICIIGQASGLNESSTVYAVTSEGGKTALVEKATPIFPAGRQDTYVLTGIVEDAKRKPASIYDAGTEETFATSIAVDDRSKHFYFTSDTSFFVLNGKGSDYQAGTIDEGEASIKSHSLKTTSGGFKGGIASINGQNGDVALVSGTDGKQYLFGPNAINLAIGFERPQ